MRAEKSLGSRVESVSISTPKANNTLLIGGILLALVGIYIITKD